VTGALSGYFHVVQIGASDANVSFGRYLNSQSAEFSVGQVAQTFGSKNAGPRVGPVVLTELMVEPVAGSDEFLELRNNSSQAVPLYDPVNPVNAWRIDGISFNFPAGVTLQPGQIVLVAPIAPATFSSKYNIPSGVTVYGPYTGALNNSGERVSLQKPGKPYQNATGQTVVPYIDVDFVTYDDLSPWPGVAGNGKSLERINASTFGDDPLNWKASVTGGTPAKPAALSLDTWLSQRFTAAQLADPKIGGRTADPDGDGIDNVREWVHGLDPLTWDSDSCVSTEIEKHADGQSYLTMHYRRSLAATGVSIFVDTASDLAAWNLGNGVTVGTPVNNGDGTETVTSRDTVPVSSSSSPVRFIRLRIAVP
jgi:hypothetical protein